MLTICDTQALLYGALAPDQLSSRAAKAIEAAQESGELACADISLWEIAMLGSKGRIPLPAPVQEFIETILNSRGFTVLPITPAIAAMATSGRIAHGDPADRLIAATAIVHGATLVTRDRQLAGIAGLATVW